jgi:2-dehydro-3-deoxyphosphogluconate aldolase/(4S)-4-hydroxy-2-oxoglutarate aldolase
VSADSTASFFDREFRDSPAMVILRGYSPAETVELCARAESLGIRLVEVPAQTPAALSSLEAALAWARGRDTLIGAGTVVTVETLRAVHGLGAQFTVAPGVDEAVSLLSQDLDMPHLPGVATATDVAAAMGLGHVWLKAFPASLLTAAWIQAMRGPFPGARFVATGGIATNNAGEFLDAGADAVSLGGAFATADTDDVRRLLDRRSS